MSLTPNAYWLTNARYLEEKRAVIVAFSRLNIRRTLRLPFFPSFFVSKKQLGKELLEELLSTYGKQRFKLAEEKRAFKVSAATFRDLNCLANIVFTATGFIPIVLQPERQFLLQRNWSYFDCFSFTSEGRAEKIGMDSLPAVNLPEFSEPLPETVKQLAKIDKGIAAKTVESIVLSNALALPFQCLPPHKSLQVEALLENAFHSHGLGRERRLEKGTGQREKAMPAATAGLTELDFSLLWPTLLTKPIYNLGFDSIGCSCCRPGTLHENNVLPNSTVMVEMQQEAFYYQSLLPEFAKRFHEANPGTKANRLRRMGEFCLPSIPVGPFSRGQRAVVPLADALQLQQGGKAEMLSVQKMHWFCTKRESALSKQIGQMQSKAASAEREAEAIYSNAVKQHGLLGPEAAEQSPLFLFKKCSAMVYSSLLSSIVEQLTSRKSTLFSSSVAEAVTAIKSSVLHSFAQFAEQRQSRFIQGKGKAFVRSEKPLTLIKQFAEEKQMPCVIHAKFGRKRG